MRRSLAVADTIRVFVELSHAPLSLLLCSLSNSVIRSRLESDAQPQANLASRCNPFLIVTFNQAAEAGIVFEVAVLS